MSMIIIISDDDMISMSMMIFMMIMIIGDEYDQWVYGECVDYCVCMIIDDMMSNRK